MIRQIKQNLLTNKFAETLLLQILMIGGSYFKKLLPANTDYPKFTFRSVRRNGLHFHLDISDYQQYLIYFNLNDDSSKPLLQHIPLKNGSIIDIGANIGQTSLWIAQMLDGKINATIHAFESYNDTYRALEKNIASNKFKNIKLYNLALGNSESEIKMIEDCESNSGGFRVLSKEHDTKKKQKKVQQTKLDKFINEIQDIFLIKIDVEGYEMEVLKGGMSTINKYKPLLYIELNDKNLKQQNSSAQEVINLLLNMGYKNILNVKTNKNITEDLSGLSNCSMDIICK